MKTLKETDLQIGDILIFEDNPCDKKAFLKLVIKLKFKKAFYHILHYLIAWFDPGKEGKNYRNIYHAAIWGKVDVNRDNNNAVLEKEVVVQAGAEGIHYATIADTLKHKQVMNLYVCRYKNSSEDFQQNIEKATKDFYKIKGSYSFETAWLLSAICSLRYTSGTLHKLLVKHFYSTKLADAFVEIILKLLNDYQNKHQREMVACSPLVAMIYKNAGYELSVNVFETLENRNLPEFNVNLEDNREELETLTSLSSSQFKEFPTLKETLVTPRQLLESPDVELVGVLHHK